MLNRITTVLFAALLLAGHSRTAAVSPVVKQDLRSTKIADLPGFAESEYGAVSDLTIDEFLDLSPKEIAEKTGQKMTIEDRLSFFLIKKNMRKQLKKAEKNEPYAFESPKDGGFQMNWGAFVLGLLLSLIGLIISFFFKDKSAWKSALIGMGVWVVIAIISSLV